MEVLEDLINKYEPIRQYRKVFDDPAVESALSELYPRSEFRQAHKQVFPRDVWLEIASYLNVFDKAELAKTCRFLYNICKHRTLVQDWKSYVGYIVGSGIWSIFSNNVYVMASGPKVFDRPSKDLLSGKLTIYDMNDKTVLANMFVINLGDLGFCKQCKKLFKFGKRFRIYRDCDCRDPRHEPNPEMIESYKALMADQPELVKLM